MISGLSHAHVWVLDQDAAKAFYTEKLGFAVKTDRTTDDGFRWITVYAPDQPDVLLVLGEAGPPMVPAERAPQLRELIASGTFGVGVLRTGDCRAAHAQLAERGVQFIHPPEPRPYGVEAVLRDDSGNWFALTELAA
jgi:catechol 2,3-dioxygenase-like lactoylglutathione lyase family enzyme